MATFDTYGNPISDSPWDTSTPGNLDSIPDAPGPLQTVTVTAKAPQTAGNATSMPWWAWLGIAAAVYYFIVKK